MLGTNYGAQVAPWIEDLDALPAVRIARLSNLSTKLGVPEEQRAWFITAIEAKISEHVPATPADSSKTEALKLKIRKFVEADTSWNEFQSLAWELLAVDPTDQMAAYLAELVVLRGRVFELLDVFAKLGKIAPHYYEAMQPHVRDYAVMRLWVEKGLSALMGFFRSANPELRPLERLACCWYELTCDHGDPVQGYLIFADYEEELQYGLREFSAKLAIKIEDFYLQLGKGAMEAQCEADAMRFLSKIPSKSQAYGEALNLLLKLNITRDPKGRSSLQKQLDEEPNWRERLIILRDNLRSILKGDLDGLRTRIAMNEVLEDPLKLIPATASARSGLANLLTSHSNMYQALPSLLASFYKEARNFQPPLIAEAFWEPVTRLRLADIEEERYLRGLAYLHLYLGSGNETQLWRAKELFDKLTSVRGFTHPPRDLFLAARKWLLRTPLKSEVERIQMLAHLAIANSSEEISREDMKMYLMSPGQPSHAILTRLHAQLINQDEYAIERDIIRKKGRYFGYTNQDLLRLFEVGGRIKMDDLSWRCATVLAGRHALPDSHVQAWRVSGECRGKHLFQAINMDQALKVSFDMNEDGKLLVKSLIGAGGFLADLISFVNRDLVSTKVKYHSQESHEWTVDKHLKVIDFLYLPRKIQVYKEMMPPAYRYPPFLENFPNNLWVHTLRRLSLYLSIDHVGWNTNEIHRYLEGIILGLGNYQNWGNLSSKLGKFLKSRSRQERRHLQNLSSVCSSIGYERGYEILIKMTVRLATLIHQNHDQALKALYGGSAPMWVIRSLETFILSDHYSKLRTELNNYSRVPIPRVFLKESKPVKNS